MHELVGPRDAVSLDDLAGLVPDLRQRDVFVSGREGFVLDVVDALARLGVPKASVHYEVYSL